jgi:hypothetical protein
MNSLLLIIGLPDISETNRRTAGEESLMKLSQLLSTIGKRSPGIEHFPPNVWRIPAENGLSFLRTALDLAGNHEFPCRVLPLDGEPRWIEGIPRDGNK